MNKRLWIALAVLVVVAIGGLILVNNNKDDDEKYKFVDHLDINKEITADDIVAAKAKVGINVSNEDKQKILAEHVLGKSDAKVTVIEYEDFACTHCQSFHTYAEKIQDDYKDRVKFIFRDFSLNYPNSVATLSAAEAAAMLGGNDAFWKMNKLLFQDEKWTGQAVEPSERKTLFRDYAKQAGVTDIDKFNTLLADTNNNGIQDRIDLDKKIGEKAGVTGTPTWIINGKKVEEVKDSTVRQAIDEALKSAGE